MATPTVALARDGLLRSTDRLFDRLQSWILPPHKAGDYSSVWPRILAIALVNALVLNIALGLITVVLWRLGILPEETTNSLSTAVLYLFQARQSDDSWRPMLEALYAHNAGLPVYDTIFYQRHTKFQYPLTALLPLQALHLAGFTEPAIRAICNAVTWLGLWLTTAVAVSIVKEIVRQKNPNGSAKYSRASVAVAGAVVLCAVAYFPLTKAYALGQIQVLINLMFAAAFLCWLRTRYVAAGLLFGLMILIKPQYGLCLLWFGLRKRFEALAAALIVAGVGVCIAALSFGWSQQFQYVEVLRYIAPRGESFWINDSVNGLLNRILFPHLAFYWKWFAEYNVVVHAATVISSALLIGIALLLPMRSRMEGRIFDFSLMAITLTAASPIAWTHHYGILFPIFCALAVALPDGRKLKCLGLAFVLTSHSWSVLNALPPTPWASVLMGVRFFGVLLLIGILVSLRKTNICADETVVATHRPHSALATSSGR